MLHDVPTESLCIVKYDQPCQERCWEIPVNNWIKTNQCIYKIIMLLCMSQASTDSKYM